MHEFSAAFDKEIHPRFSENLSHKSKEQSNVFLTPLILERDGFSRMRNVDDLRSTPLHEFRSTSQTIGCLAALNTDVTKIINGAN